MNKNEQKPESILADIKKLLLKAVNDRKSPYHNPVFSNISKNNIVESRTVVLRNFNEENNILNFHTDLRSPKIKDIQKNNKTNFLFYDSSVKIQLRIKTISKINNLNNITKSFWKITKLSSRKCYLSIKAPSSKTNSAEDSIPVHLTGIDPNKEESEKGYENFAVVRNKIKIIEWLNLSASGHRRLRIHINQSIIKYSWLIP